MYNYSEMNLNLKRIDVCDLLIALSSVMETSDSEKWERLHSVIFAQLSAFDAEHEDDID